MQRKDHSVVLMKRNNQGGWDVVKDNHSAIVIDDLTLEKIAWLNTVCKAEYKWANND